MIGRGLGATVMIALAVPGIRNRGFIIFREETQPRGLMICRKEIAARSLCKNENNAEKSKLHIQLMVANSPDSHKSLVAGASYTL